MKILNVEKFALAVINSSDSNLSVDEKIKLYVEACEKAKEHNSEQPIPKGSTSIFK